MTPFPAAPGYSPKAPAGGKDQFIFNAPVLVQVGVSDEEGNLHDGKRVIPREEYKRSQQELFESVVRLRTAQGMVPPAGVQVVNVLHEPDCPRPQGGCCTCNPEVGQPRPIQE
jgi:hypothetical protein